MNYILSKDIKFKLFHLSFNGNIAGMWDPKLPDGLYGEKGDLSEPDVPRISVSPTLKQCFQAIYPNISKYFEKENYPYLIFYVYVPLFTGNEKVWTPEILKMDKLVHDAHITGEHAILNSVEMVLYQKIKIKNTKNSKDLMYRPFDDNKYTSRFLSPADVNIEVIETFHIKQNNGNKHLNW